MWMKHREVLSTRARVAAQLPPPTEIVRGSLLKRKIRHRQGCPKCQRGEGHTVWVLTVSYAGGTTKQFSIRPEHRKQVQQWLDNYQDLKGKLEQICELNHKLLRPEK